MGLTKVGSLPITTPLKSPKTSPRIKCRYFMVLLAFAAQFYFFALRSSMGISIVAMVNNSALSIQEGAKSDDCPNLMRNESDPMEFIFKKDGEFLWPPKLQGYVLGCSFLFFVIATAPAGKITELFGCKNVLFWGSFIPTLLTFLSPFAAWCHLYLLIVVQSFRGLFQAAIIPALAALIGNWSPKSERGFSYTIVLCGSSWGSAAGGYISGLLCKTPGIGGWPVAFFLFGGSGIIVSLCLLIFMYDNPSVHPKISEAELKYILENQENAVAKKRPKTPWCSLFTSIPVYAFGYAVFGQMWAITHFFSVHPTFLGTIMHYPIQQNGLFSALPFLLQFVTALGGGWLSNFLNSKNYMSVDTSRKFWNFLSCLGYSSCMLGMYFAGCNRPVTIVLSIAALACTGFSYAGCFITAPDMSPTFAASVIAFACTLGNSSNFIVPVVVGFVTNGNQTLEQWNKIFLISIGVVMSSGIVFAVFGSAKVQPWNDVHVREEKEETRF